MFRLSTRLFSSTTARAATTTLPGSSLAGKAATVAAAAGVLRMKHTLPDLPYDYNALEPVISADIMRLHHDKHHQAYVNGLNAAEEQLVEATNTSNAAKIAQIQSAIRFNAGGHINHSIFWNNLVSIKEGGGQLQAGALKSAIEAEFGSLEKLSKLMNAQTVAIQGSGWGWLVLNPNTGKLEIVTLPNQDTPAMIGRHPLLGIDIWEHAFYLDYKNVKADYLNNIWKIVNWKDVEKRYEEGLKLVTSN
ncbi:Superoxide dismutase [Mn], mitochondrial [Mycoemilia scoparia]|uniref:Superoxide dismutase n=1 Tax=Mycoemilia scoparia TaxID=417184 RepID=A0A9W7ZVT1_9FUNG|nr:Superoxide dismutase [Mn], mitochondrial [Mycoemilia scoparia]